MVVAAVVGTVASAGASLYASSQQSGAARNAQNIAQNQFQTIQRQEAPYMQAGGAATNQLNYLLGEGNPSQYGTMPQGQGGFGSLNAPFTADMMKQYSPAYQFQMQQGQQGVLNQETGTGALSGAALKDLTSFNQGYANTAFNNAFTQYNTQQSNTYNRLMGLSTLGQNAASNTGAQGTALAQSAAQSAQNVGTAQAAGGIGVGNAISQGALWASYGGGAKSPGDPNYGLDYVSASPSAQYMTTDQNFSNDLSATAGGL